MKDRVEILVRVNLALGKLLLLRISAERAEVEIPGRATLALLSDIKKDGRELPKIVNSITESQYQQQYFSLSPFLLPGSSSNSLVEACHLRNLFVAWNWPRAWYIRP